MVKVIWERHGKGKKVVYQSWTKHILTKIRNLVFVPSFVLPLCNICIECILNLILTKKNKKTCPQLLTWKRTAKRKLTTTPTPGRSLTRWIVVAFLCVLFPVHKNCTDLFFCLSCHTIILSLRRIINSHSIVYYILWAVDVCHMKY